MSKNKIFWQTIQLNPLAIAFPRLQEGKFIHETITSALIKNRLNVVVRSPTSFGLGRNGASLLKDPSYPWCSLYRNHFFVVSLLALLVGLNLSFLIGALAWFIRITKAAPLESVEMFCKDALLACTFFSFHQ